MSARACVESLTGLPWHPPSRTAESGCGRPSDRARRARAQPEGRLARPAARRPDRLHRPVRLGQVLPGVRHDLRRGPAPLRRVAVRVRAAVPRARWTSRTSTSSRASPRRSRSTRSRPRRNPRSTVGTITEVYDYLRLLFARAGQPHCPECGRPIARQTPQQIVDRVLELDGGHPVPGARPGRPRPQGRVRRPLRRAADQGLRRARVDGVTIQLTEPPKLKKQEKHTIEVVVDRLTVKERQAAADRLGRDRARPGRRLVILDFVDLPEDDPHRERMFSEHLACPYDDLSFDELEPRSFSFNSPFGACPECTGLGTRMEVDPELIVPDPEQSLDEGAIHAVVRHGHTRSTSCVCSRRSRRPGLHVRTPRGASCRQAQEVAADGPRPQVHVRTRTATAGSGRTTPPSRV